MTTVELKFPLIGKTLPTDQGYALYGAISRLVPEVHAADWFALETIPGVARGDGTTQLDPHGKLRMRLPQEHVALLLKLAGKPLHLNGQSIRLGAPEISLLQPSAALYARIVTIKGFTEPEPFTDAVCRKLNERAIRGEVVIGPRRVLQVGNHKIVGFGLAIHELSDEASIQLQTDGLGGRRKMGCGYFNPIRLDRVIGEIPKRMQEVLNYGQ
jgi:CRISPR-associated endonuclease/helicase Cas3